MQVVITQATPWSRALDAARWTVSKGSIDKEPSDSWKVKSIMSAHSPKRMVEYDIKIYGLPYWVATHFVRHHVGVEKFQATLRDDRNKLIKDRGSLAQDEHVNLWMSCNVEALINISLLRLCNKASKETREVWTQVVKEIEKLDPIVARFLVPQCVYRGFCPEDPEDKTPCNYVKTKEFVKRLSSYRDGFRQNTFLTF